jgi:hypothetical protein
MDAWQKMDGTEAVSRVRWLHACQKITADLLRRPKIWRAVIALAHRAVEAGGSLTGQQCYVTIEQFHIQRTLTASCRIHDAYDRLVRAKL